VINLSLGGAGPCDGSDAFRLRAMRRLTRGHRMRRGGQFGPQASSVGARMRCKVITVGASSDNDTVASFSGRGPTSDGRISPISYSLASTSCLPWPPYHDGDSGG